MSQDNEAPVEFIDRGKSKHFPGSAWLAISFILFISTAMLSTYILSYVLTHPLDGLRAAPYLISAICIIISSNRLFALLQSYAKKYRIKVLFRAAKWLLPVIAAMFIIMAVESGTLKNSLEVIEEDLEPVIEAIEGSGGFIYGNELPKHLSTDMNIGNLSYYRGDGYFVLAVQSGSIDIDGYTVYYHSDTNELNRLSLLHNDTPENDSEVSRKYYQSIRAIRPYSYRKSTGGWKCVDCDSQQGYMQ